MNEDIISLENRGTSRYSTEIFDINSDGFEDIIIAGGESVDWQINDGFDMSPLVIYYGPDFNDEVIILPKSSESTCTIALDLGFFDMDDNGTYEILVYRTSGDYSAWYIQVLGLENGTYVDKTSELASAIKISNKRIED